MERLDKLLAATGRWSRREVKQLVRQGQGLVNGVPAASAEEKYDPASAAFTVCGQPLTLRRYTYVLLHKPAGVLTATEDRRQPTVLELLPPELRRIDLAPVGRLDKDTEGLLLLTNDGELTHRLLSPRYHVDKRYLARVDGDLSPVDRRHDSARRPCVSARRPGAAAPAPHLHRHPAGGQIPSGQADAGRLRCAGAVSEAPVHGAAHAAG